MTHTPAPTRKSEIRVSKSERISKLEIRMSGLVIGVLVLLGSSGCSTNIRAPVTAPPPSTAEADRKALLDTDAAFSRLCEEKGAPQAFYEFLAPEATALPTGELPIKGREAIRIRLSAGTNGVWKWK